MRSKTMAWVLALAAASLATAAPLRAEDTLKVAVGQLTTWENQMTLIGQDIFKKHGIVLENFGTNGAGETLQAVISGSADIGIGNSPDIAANAQHTRDWTFFGNAGSYMQKRLRVLVHPKG